MLIPALSKLGIALLDASITLKDVTGSYNVSTNPGGYGSPNITSPAGAIGLTFNQWNEAAYEVNFATNNSAIRNGLLATDGYPFAPGDLGLTSFPAGVHVIKYYPFEVKNVTVDLKNGSNIVAVTVDGGSVIPALNSAYKAVVFTTTVNSLSSQLKSNVKLLDRITSWDSGTFLLAEPWDGDDVQSVGVGFATEAVLKVIFTSATDGCLAQAIAKIPLNECTCEHDNVNKLLLLVAWVAAAKAKFDCLDYDGADILISQASAECNDCVIQNCKTCT